MKPHSSVTNCSISFNVLSEVTLTGPDKKRRECSAFHFRDGRASSTQITSTIPPTASPLLANPSASTSRNLSDWALRLVTCPQFSETVLGCDWLKVTDCWYPVQSIPCANWPQPLVGRLQGLQPCIKLSLGGASHASRWNFRKANGMQQAFKIKNKVKINK